MFALMLRECLCVRSCSWSRLEVFVIVTMDGYAAVVGDGSRHRGCSRHDACCWVVTQDGVCGFAIFPPATEDVDLSVTH